MSEIEKIVLCADDEPDMHMLYERFLRRRGYRVVSCLDGAAVLATLDRQLVDLVILDLNMPGMGGMDTLEMLRKRLDTFNIPIIIVSGEDSEESIVHGLSSGADEYIVKPFKASELLAKVAIAIRKKQDATSRDMGLALGSKFAGRYEIAYQIGTGGFSTVYNAIDTQAEPMRPVAFKMFDLPPSKRNDRQFISGFLREAYEHSKLDHPNIIKLYDFGQLQGIYFLAMEYVDGQSLDTYVKENGKLPESLGALVCMEMAKALGYMQTQEIVHRDVKPANIMLTTDNGVKLLDFGLAKKQSEETLSLDDEFKGTPQFVSPEYIRDQPLDVASDIYSLGATLYYLLSGVPPIVAESTIEILRAHLQVKPLPLIQVEPSISIAFSDLIAQMLEKDPADRPNVREISTQSRMIMRNITAVTD